MRPPWCIFFLVCFATCWGCCRCCRLSSGKKPSECSGVSGGPEQLTVRPSIMIRRRRKRRRRSGALASRSKRHASQMSLCCHGQATRAAWCPTHGIGCLVFPYGRPKRSRGEAEQRYSIQERPFFGATGVLLGHIKSAARRDVAWHSVVLPRRRHSAQMAAQLLRPSPASTE